MGCISNAFGRFETVALLLVHTAHKKIVRIRTATDGIEKTRTTQKKCNAIPNKLSYRQNKKQTPEVLKNENYIVFAFCLRLKLHIHLHRWFRCEHVFHPILTRHFANGFFHFHVRRCEGAIIHFATVVNPRKECAVCTEIQNPTGLKIPELKMCLLWVQRINGQRNLFARRKTFFHTIGRRARFLIKKSLSCFSNAKQGSVIF